MNEKLIRSADAGTEKSVSSAIPPEAEKEIIDRLFRETHASSDEMADILERYGVCGDSDALQRAYLKNRVQKIMSRCRDSEGKRQVLAGKNGMYYVVPLCNDLEALGDIEQRLQQQSAGLNRSSDIVTRRMEVLRDMLDSLKAAYRKRMTDREESAP